jgi:hypothetical protein
MKKSLYSTLTLACLALHLDLRPMEKVDKIEIVKNDPMDIVTKEEKEPFLLLKLPDEMIIEVCKQVYYPKGYQPKPKDLKTLDALIGTKQDPLLGLKTLFRLSVACKKTWSLAKKSLEKLEIANANEAYYMDRLVKGEAIATINFLANDEIDSPEKNILRKALFFEIDGKSSLKCF